MGKSCSAAHRCRPLRAPAGRARGSRALLDGLWPLNPRVLAQRLPVLALCVLAAVLPNWYAPPDAADDNVPPAASAVITQADTFCKQVDTFASR